jgi:hypothetical protein
MLRMPAADQAHHIRCWRADGTNRLTGEVFYRPGFANGAEIMTSPVQFIRFEGEPAAPVAYTRSGSRYRLGDASPLYGSEAASEFVFRMSWARQVLQTLPDELSFTLGLKRR